MTSGPGRANPEVAKETASLGPAGPDDPGPEVLLEVPATAPQRRLWAVEGQSGGAAVHNISFQVNWPLQIEAEPLAAALADLAERHEALRTSFRLAGGTLHQQVHSAADVRIPVQSADLRGMSHADADHRLREIRQQVAAIPFDLASPPLIRLLWVRRDQEDPGCEKPVTPLDLLVFVVHHIVADARSSHLIAADLTQAYRARAAGHAPDWEPVPIQYADFSAWLADQASSPQAARDLEYWREHLAGLTELDLTQGRPRPAEPSPFGHILPVDIEPSLTAKIAALTKRERVTPFMVMVAAYAWALGRVFGATDVAVGTSLSTRTVPEVSTTVGMFVDRMVLRCDSSGRPTFRQLLRRCRAEVLEAQEHGQVGFDRIVEALAPPRRYGVEPLVQASVNLQPAAAAGAGTDEEGQFGNGTVRHDLALDLADHVSCYRGTLESRDGVVPADAARRVADVFLATLEAAVARPESPLDAVLGLDAAELAKLHASDDGGPALHHDGKDVLQLIDRWVARTPDAIAVDGPEGTMSYRDLAGTAAAIAAELRRRGVRCGEPVLVPLPRCTPLAAALIGALAAGAAYVPVDPGAPSSYLAIIARAVEARFAIVGPASRTELPAGLTAIRADQAGALPDGSPLFSQETHPAQTAYVLFTSGSTGNPKGVVVERRSILGYVGALLALLSPPPGAVHVLVQSPTFDSSLGTILGSLCSGGVLRLVSEDAAVDPAMLGAQLGDAPADYLKITPSHLTALLSGIPEAVLRPRRGLVLGGESARHDLVRRLVQSGWTVYGHYGPTETTVGVLAHQLGETTAAPSQTVPLGRPLPGVRVYVLDEYGAPVPPGCLGELCIGGDLVSRGYAGLPAVTAAAFIPDPYSGQPGARMYRTGDLVRRLPDQTFEFGGRGDRQVKVRGHRIEPAEIETALAAIDGVSQVAVALRAGTGTDRLVGYVVAAPGHSLDSRNLRAELAGQLPAHLMPDAVAVLDRLPLLPSGKLDLAALPQPQAEEDRDEDFAEPSTAQEASLAEVWRQVLGLDRVSVTTRFFDAGGDSITAIEVVSLARARGLRLSTRELFEHQTIRGLAARIAAGAAVPLPVRAAQAGLGGVASPVVIRMTVSDPAAVRSSMAGPGTPPGWSCDGGLQLNWREQDVELIADPARCDDRSLAEIAALLADQGATAPSRQLAASAGGLPAGTASCLLSSGVAEALTCASEQLAAVHDKYGTEPLDLATAAVFGALCADTGQPASAAGQRGAEQAIVLGDCGAGGATAGLGQRAVPAMVTFGAQVAEPAADAGSPPDPGDLLRAAKAAIRQARAGAADWAEAALAGQSEVPGIVVRLLPLPAAARLTDAGTRGLTDRASRTVVLVTGTELLVIPAGQAGDHGDYAGFARRIATELDRLVAHCAGGGPVYSPLDFPEAGLDDAALARLLDRIGDAR